MDCSPYIDFAHKLADASGEVIRRYYRQPCAVDAKADASPVTQADREAEKAIREMITQVYPDHGVIGEEFGSHNTEADWQWIIDPIDGTKSFMIGRPIFGTLISLAYQGKPVLGVIDQPINKERWIGGENLPSSCNGKSIQTRACDDISQAVLCTTAPELFSAEEKAQFDTLALQVKYVIYGGDCYSYALVAMGLVDIVLESQLQPYDFAALVPVVTHAGGQFTDWNGKNITLDSAGSALAVGDIVLHSEIVRLLSR